MTAAFLDMDRRQTIAEAGVQASAQMYPDKRMAHGWEAIRAGCYAASGNYLELSGRLEQAKATGEIPPALRAAVEPAVRKLTAAAESIDRFYRADQAHFEQATALLATVPQLADQTAAAADGALRDALGAGSFADYPSVRTAMTTLDSAVTALDVAKAAGKPAQIRPAAVAVETATKALRAALAEAPGRASAAHTALASANTRLSAARTRVERIGPAYSALLREFSAASSADLTGNERQASAAIELAATDLAAAKAALAEAKPEEALERTNSARTHLAAAERSVDAVTDRVALLRAVRADPEQKEKAVRFRLRDAQMLAVGRGLVGEWGSVLDAQVERIDRVAATLAQRHPDYWAYVTGLDAISDFIAGAVDKMRKQA